VSEIFQRTAMSNSSTRRKLLSNTAIILGSLAASSNSWGRKQPASKADAGSAPNQDRTSLHQEVSLKGPPGRVYEALLSSKEFAAFSAAPAAIDATAGGAFSLFGGLIVGRNVELIPNQRIVQAWRPTHWSPGVYSIVRFELKPNAAATLVALNHTGFPEGEFDHLSSGWRQHYWERLMTFLA
jgi:activator of HSP90 ATPase